MGVWWVGAGRVDGIIEGRGECGWVGGRGEGGREVVECLRRGGKGAVARADDVAEWSGFHRNARD